GCPGVTPAPTARTSAANSCPGVTGRREIHCPVLKLCRSDPQIPAARTRSPTEPAGGGPGTGTSSTRRSPIPCSRTAFIRRPTSGRYYSGRGREVSRIEHDLRPDRADGGDGAGRIVRPSRGQKPGRNGRRAARKAERADDENWPAPAQPLDLAGGALQRIRGHRDQIEGGQAAIRGATRAAGQLRTEV